MIYIVGYCACGFVLFMFNYLNIRKQHPENPKLTWEDFLLWSMGMAIHILLWPAILYGMIKYYQEGDGEDDL